MINTGSIIACLSAFSTLATAEAIPGVDHRGGRLPWQQSHKTPANPIKYLEGSAVKTSMMSDPPQAGSTQNLFLPFGMGRFDYWPQVDCYHSIGSVASASMDRTVVSKAIANAYTATMGRAKNGKDKSAWGFFTLGGTKHSPASHHLLAHFDYYDRNRDRHFRLNEVYALVRQYRLIGMLLMKTGRTRRRSQMQALPSVRTKEY